MKHLNRPHVIMPIAALVLAVCVAAGAALFTSTRPAYADIKGPCSATIAGVDVAGLDPNDAGDAIDVDFEDDVVVSMSSSRQFRSHKIELEFARYLGGSVGRVPVEHREDAGERSFTETVDVSDFAWAGVGLYKVKGKATLADGSTCEGAALVNIGGRHPLITIAGGVAALVGVVVTALTLAALFAGAVGSPGGLDAIRRMVEEARRAEPAEREEVAQERARRASRKGLLRGIVGWLSLLAIAVITVPLMTVGGGGSADASEGGEQPPSTSRDQGRRLPRAPWVPRITVLGLVNGVLAGAAGLVLLQQFAVTYPALWLMITLVVLGAVIYGLVLPTLGYTIAWLRVNRRVGDLERSLGWK